mmetsp:Transcript_9402/g.24235  ORF Transcript_9402/g.24235 Transcript_9402/m.24235 type:complete len:200 (-) Transcript_9402:1340-1939(-)
MDQFVPLLLHVVVRLARQVPELLHAECSLKVRPHRHGARSRASSDGWTIPGVLGQPTLEKFGLSPLHLVHYRPKETMQVPPDVLGGVPEPLGLGIRCGVDPAGSGYRRERSAGNPALNDVLVLGGLCRRRRKHDPHQHISVYPTLIQSGSVHHLTGDRVRLGTPAVLPKHRSTVFAVHHNPVAVRLAYPLGRLKVLKHV